MNAKDEDRHPHRRSIPPRNRNKRIEGRVYIVHLDEPVGASGHYTGSTKKPRTAEERLEDHKAGNGSALLREANRRGIDYHIVRDWPGNPHIENQLKLSSAKKYCPECTENPRVPKIVQAAIRRERREAKKAEREAARTKKIMEIQNRSPSPAQTAEEKFSSGARTGDIWAMQQINTGRSSEEIERTFEEITGPYYDGPKAGTHDPGHQGFEMAFASDLELLRDLQRRGEAEQEHEVEMEAG